LFKILIYFFILNYRLELETKYNVIIF